MDNFSPLLSAFCRRFEISVRRFSDLCGGAQSGVSPSTAHRLLQGQLDEAHTRRLQPIVARALAAFLRGRGLDLQQLQDELLPLFPDGEFDMITHRTELEAEAVQFFGFRHDPFTGDPRRADEVFTFPALERIKARVEDAIRYQGFLAVVGDIGSGKTILRKRVQETVDKSDGQMRLLWPEFFDMSRVNTSAIASFILSEFDQKIPRDNVAKARKIKRLLGDLHAADTRVALAFDECHRLDDKVLSALKNFWEMGSGGFNRYLGVVMFGQPLLGNRLREAKFREIVERIQVVRMPDITKVAAGYIAHRLACAGGDADALFEPEAIARLAAQAQIKREDGSVALNPLALGNVTNATLERAFNLRLNRIPAAFIESDAPKTRASRQAAAK
jgi:type II secretory pathway predicted ATPase ExeA